MILGVLFQTGGLDCSAVSQEVVIPRDIFNAIQQKGSGACVMQLTPSFAVTPGSCQSSSITVTLEYQPATVGDCNANGVPDVCDIKTGSASDANQDGVPGWLEPSSGGAPWTMYTRRSDTTRAFVLANYQFNGNLQECSAAQLSPFFVRRCVVFLR